MSEADRVLRESRDLVRRMRLLRARARWAVVQSRVLVRHSGALLVDDLAVQFDEERDRIREAADFN